MSGEVASSRANTLGLRAGAPAAGTLSNGNGTDSLQSMLHALDELANTHLPNVQRLGATLFDEMCVLCHGHSTLTAGHTRCTVMIRACAKHWRS